MLEAVTAVIGASEEPEGLVVIIAVIRDPESEGCWAASEPDGLSVVIQGRDIASCFPILGWRELPVKGLDVFAELDALSDVVSCLPIPAWKELDVTVGRSIASCFPILALKACIWGRDIVSCSGIVPCPSILVLKGRCVSFPVV